MSVILIEVKRQVSENLIQMATVCLEFNYGDDFQLIDLHVKIEVMSLILLLF